MGLNLNLNLNLNPNLKNFLINTYSTTTLLVVPFITLISFDGFYNKKIHEKWGFYKTVEEFALMVGFCTFYSVFFPIFLPIDLYRAFQKQIK